MAFSLLFLFWAVVLIAACVSSRVAICGFTAYPDNPLVYELFSAGPS